MKEERCKKIVYGSHWWHRHQCLRNVWKNGYCKQHHPDSVKERERKSEERWKKKQENSLWNQLTKARQKIKELEEKIKELGNSRQ